MIFTPSTMTRFMDKVMMLPDAPGCWLWTAYCDEHGYGVFVVSTRNNQKAHRVAYELMRELVPMGLCVLHRCDTPSCVNPAHLFLGTQADNMLDRSQKGRNADQQGTSNSNAILSEHQVGLIRRATGTHAQIATEFGVSRSAVTEIRTRRTWSHL